MFSLYGYAIHENSDPSHLCNQKCQWEDFYELFDKHYFHSYQITYPVEYISGKIDQIYFGCPSSHKQLEVECGLK